MVSAVDATAFAIRRMVDADLDRVVEIAAGQETAPHWERSAYTAALRAMAPLRIALVAEVCGAVAGFAIANVLGAQAELESIAVAEEVQGHGVGRALLARLIDEAALAGAEEMMLELRASNARAEKLYASAGFVEVGRRPDYYRDPAEDAILLRLEIRQVN